MFARSGLDRFAARLLGAPRFRRAEFVCQWIFTVRLDLSRAGLVAARLAGWQAKLQIAIGIRLRIGILFERFRVYSSSGLV